ncbi:hypothetical protein GCM10028819_09760 [Spirosoma humi]
MFISIIRKTGYALGLLSLALACKPGTEPTASSEPVKPGVPTAVGKPLSAQLSKTIGPAGGTLSSADGTMRLRVPPGALSKETLITAQPVENTAFGGAGVGYEFGPHGTQFAKPVTLSWTYKDADLRGSSPEALGIAYQDDKGIWQGRNNLVVIANQHRVVAPLYHFSRYSFYENFWMEPTEKTLAPNETVELKVFYQENHALWEGTGADLPDTLKTLNEMLTPLTNTVELLKEDQVKNWQINGQTIVNKPDSPIGTMGRNEGKSVYYRAPAKAPEKNPIAVSVEIVLKGKRKLLLLSNLTIESPNELFIGGSKQPEAYAAADITQGYLAVSVTGKLYDGTKQAGVSIQLIGINGPGSYNLNKENEGKLTVNGTDKALTDYFWTYTPFMSKPVYGPGNITITEYDAKNQVVAGSFSATLHHYNASTKVYKSLAVKGQFRTGG